MDFLLSIYENKTKLALYLMLGYLSVFVLKPVYWGAWKTKKTADIVSVGSKDKTRREVKEDFVAALKAAKIELASEDIFIEGRTGEWVVGAQFSSNKNLFGKYTLVFDFEVRSDRQAIW